MKAENERKWSARWNPTNPIDECYIIDIVALPAYTMEQVINKATIAIQQMGVYKLAILEWNCFDPVNKD